MDGRDCTRNFRRFGGSLAGIQGGGPRLAVRWGPCQKDFPGAPNPYPGDPILHASLKGTGNPAHGFSHGPVSSTEPRPERAEERLVLTHGAHQTPLRHFHQANEGRGPAHASSAHAGRAGAIGPRLGAEAPSWHARPIQGLRTAINSVQHYRFSKIMKC
jgi:hypothetical protein